MHMVFFLDGAMHTSVHNANYPKIPVQPICYDDARYLMRFVLDRVNVKLIVIQSKLLLLKLG